jgi:hypothetical protein
LSEKLRVNGGTNSTLSYDLNGNMLSDGTNKTARLKNPFGMISVNVSLLE